MTKVKGIAESVTPAQSAAITKTDAEHAAEKLQRYMKEESVMVRGRFRSFENPGAREKISFKKYPTPTEMRMRKQEGGVVPFEKWMVDGEEYEIPLYVARFLNGVDVTAEQLEGRIGSCSYAIHGFKWSPGQPMPVSGLGSGPDGQGGIPVPIIGVSKRVRRMGFESLQFDAMAS